MPAHPWWWWVPALVGALAWLACAADAWADPLGPVDPQAEVGASTPALGAADDVRVNHAAPPTVSRDVGARCFAVAVVLTPARVVASVTASGDAPPGFWLPVGFSVVAGGGLGPSNPAGPTTVVVACEVAAPG